MSEQASRISRDEYWKKRKIEDALQTIEDLQREIQEIRQTVQDLEDRFECLVSDLEMRSDRLRDEIRKINKRIDTEHYGR